MSTQAQRDKAGRIMDTLVRYRARVHYAQRRPMRTMSIKPGHLTLALLKPGGITMDCSESVTLICHLAGLRDPNGLHYNGQGFTGTLLDHLEHYANPHRARTGALVVFGAAPGEHVAMVRHAGSDPECFSHGTEADPRYFKLSELSHAFPGQPHTFLSIGKLGVG